MKRTVVALAAAATLAACPAVFAADGPSASGSGHITFGSSQEHVSFNATGVLTAASGQAEVVDHTASGLVRFHVDVNCLNVFGSTAIVSGIVTKSNIEALVGDQAIFEVVDNGEGSGAPPDLMSLVNLYAPGVGPDCTVPSEFDLAPLEGGNIQVQE